MHSKARKNIAAQLWHLPDAPSATLASVVYEDFCFEPHFHEHYVIMLVERGVNLGRCGRQQYDVCPGEMLLIRPGETHTGRSFEGRELRYLVFYPEPASMARWLEMLEPKHSKVPDFSLKQQNPLLSQSFQHLFASVSAGGSEPLATDTALCIFLENLTAAQPGLVGRPSKLSADSQKFRKAQAFIHDRFAENFSLDELAAAAETTATHLIRLFRLHSGLTPFHYLRSVRVEQAKQLMHREKSLTEVGYQVGFYDQSHFIRSFKHCTGFQPSAFRRHCR